MLLQSFRVFLCLVWLAGILQLACALDTSADWQGAGRVSQEIPSFVGCNMYSCREVAAQALAIAPPVPSC